MASQRKISIRKSGEGKVKFDPDPRNATTKQGIFWANYDDKPHWPGRLLDNGDIDEKYFMEYQIAPGGSSGIWGSPVEFKVRYACSLHPDETGTIEVTEPPSNE